MNQQALDLRRSAQIVWRHKLLLGIGAALGLLAGLAYSLLSPPVFTSTALVVLPQAAAQFEQAGAVQASTGTSSYMATEVVVATSDPVLSGALPNVSPAMPLATLRSKVNARSMTEGIFSISATGGTAAQAETTANAVARSYVTYVGSAGSDVGRVLANVLESATSAERPSPAKQLLVNGLVGALVGALIAAITALAIGRRDRRLRKRDEIADSIGVPVLASLPVAHPADAAGWTKLFEDYEPEAVHALQLRKLLQLLGEGDLIPHNGGGDGGYSVTVVSVSSDRGALALGPQLAIFAASQGIPTVLVIGPHQDTDAAAALRTACAAPAPESWKRQSPLRVAVYPDDDAYERPDGAFTVVVSVVDSGSPRMPDTIPTTATALGVSTGAVTAEQLARVAVSAAVSGREVTAILVADPDPADRTTGRVPQLARPVRRTMPTRLNGLATETTR